MYKLLISSSILLFRNNLNEVCSQHFDTILADSGSDTIDKLFSEKPEIIFMDCNYSDIDSLELIEKVKKHNPHILIYFFVGSLNKKESAGATKLNVMEICRKPVQNITIEQILKKIPKNHLDKLEDCIKYYEEKYPTNLEEMVFELEEENNPKTESSNNAPTSDDIDYLGEIVPIDNTNTKENSEVPIPDIEFEFEEEDEIEEETKSKLEQKEHSSNVEQKNEEMNNEKIVEVQTDNTFVSPIQDEQKTKEITQYITMELSKLLEDKKGNNSMEEKNFEENLSQVQENITTSISKELHKILSKKQEVDINGVVLEINKNFKEYEQRILSKLSNKNNSIEEIDKLLKITNQGLNDDLQNLFLSYNESLIVVLEDILITNQKLVTENKLLMEQYNILLTNQNKNNEVLLNELLSIKSLISNSDKVEIAISDTISNDKTTIEPEKVVLENNDEYNTINNETSLEDKSKVKDDNNGLVFEFEEIPPLDENPETNESNQEMVEETDKKLPAVSTSGPLIKPAVYNVFQEVPTKADDESIGLIHFDDEPINLPEEQNKKIGVFKSLFSKKH